MRWPLLLWLGLSLHALPHVLPRATRWAPDNDADSSTLECGTRVDTDWLAALIHRHHPNFDRMRNALRDYLSDVIMPAAEAGCTFISLTQAQLRMRRSAPTSGTADDARPEGCEAVARARIDAKAGKVTAAQKWAQELGRRRRHSLWTQQAQRIGNTARTHGRRRTAILLVQDGIERLQYHLSALPHFLAMNLFYADSFGYDVLLFLRARPVPDGSNAYFIKIPAAYGALYGLQYDTVLGTDWDTYADPKAAVSLRMFTVGWRQAGLFLQAEPQVGAGVLIYRRQRNTRALLQDWWELGLTGKYTTRKFHDQTALRRLMWEHLWELTGDHTWGPEVWANSTNHRPYLRVTIDKYAAHEAQLREHSVFGLTGLHAEHDRTEVALTSCGGIWDCIPGDAPALMLHTGHWSIEKDFVVERFMAAVKMWADMRDDPATASEALGVDQGMDGK